MLTAERLRAALHYDPATGVFEWLVSRPNCRAGDVAGCPTRYGYVYVGLDGRKYMAHQLAWLWMTGAWPAIRLDHRDLDKANNRWTNLRQATRSQNGANTKVSRKSASGLKGITQDKRSGRWYAAITVNQKRRKLGGHDTAEAAHAAYVKAAAEAFGEFARAA